MEDPVDPPHPGSVELAGVVVLRSGGGPLVDDVAVEGDLVDVVVAGERGGCGVGEAGLVEEAALPCAGGVHAAQLVAEVFAGGAGEGYFDLDDGEFDLAVA